MPACQIFCARIAFPSGTGPCIIQDGGERYTHDRDSTAEGMQIAAIRKKISFKQKVEIKDEQADLETME
jgi:hypothetical protein